jgi:hypothetical protein
VLGVDDVIAHRRADAQQAEYFHRLLTAQRGLLYDRIAKWEAKLARGTHSHQPRQQYERRGIRALKADLYHIDKMLGALDDRLAFSRQ